MSKRFPAPVKNGISKARRQMSIWISTDEIVTLLSERMGISKTEIIHLAIVDMAKVILPESTHNE